MDRYSMHSAHVRMFMPNKKKRTNNRRDKELLNNYGKGIVFAYDSLGFYK